ncbi:DNA-binding protein [Schaedlerella arabinosiphila]
MEKQERNRKMKFLTTTETGKKWNLSARRVGVLCSEGRIPDVQKTGNTWLIPENAEKPADARIKSGKYIKSKIETEEQAE